MTTGLMLMQDIVSKRRTLLFGHFDQLNPDVPAHQALWIYEPVHWSEARRQIAMDSWQAGRPCLVLPDPDRRQNVIVLTTRMPVSTVAILE